MGQSGTLLRASGIGRRLNHPPARMEARGARGGLRGTSTAPCAHLIHAEREPGHARIHHVGLPETATARRAGCDRALDERRVLLVVSGDVLLSATRAVGGSFGSFCFAADCSKTCSPNARAKSQNLHSVGRDKSCRRRDLTQVGQHLGELRGGRPRDHRRSVVLREKKE